MKPLFCLETYNIIYVYSQYMLVIAIILCVNYCGLHISDTFINEYNKCSVLAGIIQSAICL